MMPVITGACPIEILPAKDKISFFLILTQWPLVRDRGNDSLSFVNENKSRPPPGTKTVGAKKIDSYLTKQFIIL